MASLACVAGALGFIVACDANAQTRINIDMSRTVGEVPALIYGAGAEDVNHEIYGGLYDQRIFGESMEEPAVSDVEGFVQYDSPWAVSGDVLGLHTGSHGKIVYQCPAMRKGRISTDVRLDGGSAIAGIIFNVSEASAGADAFVGYEISLDASRKTLVVGRYRHNWSSLANVPVEFDPKAWNTLAVDFDGAKAGISLNGKAVYELDDTAEPITGGMPGLRSYGGPASFRNFTVDGRPWHSGPQSPRPADSASTTTSGPSAAACSRPGRRIAPR